MSLGPLVAARLERAQVQVGPDVLRRLCEYFTLLARWNRRINLTSLPLEPPQDAAIDRLLVDPLRAVPFIAEGALTWIDIGSGGGSPAVPIKLMRPAARLTMTESRARKAAFLRECIRTLELPSTTVFADRFETTASLPQFAGTFDLVTIRAVRIDEPIAEGVSSVLHEGGDLLLFGEDPGPLASDARFESVPLKASFVAGAQPPTIRLFRRQHVPRGT
jgi:16S rRNA (guanine(527)-N(7))-methyltransferase RsmG